MKKAVRKSRYDLATVFFIGIVIVSIIGVVLPINRGIIWLILGICGAVVAIQNIRLKEENSFLIGTTALLIVITTILIIPEFNNIAMSFIGSFLANLAIGFGVAGFIVALGLISRLGLEK
jgi:hypothetical protein